MDSDLGRGYYGTPAGTIVYRSIAVPVVTFSKFLSIGWFRIRSSLLLYYPHQSFISLLIKGI